MKEIDDTELPTSKPLSTGFSFGGPLDTCIPEPTLRQYEIQVPAIPKSKTDEFWMYEAIRESMNGIGITNPNPAVGCIILDKNGNCIARGSTQAFGGLHAERVAMQNVRDPKHLEGATVYVTLEPCSHQGNQPPCVDLLAQSSIHRVVIAKKDSNPIVNGQGITKLLESGKKVHIGTLASEATAWNFPFFAYHHLNRPIFALKWAQTLDGQLADDSGKSKWITGPAARAYTHWLRQRYDAILVGASTFLTDLPRLSARDCALPHQSQPLPIIFDPSGICAFAENKAQRSIEENFFDLGKKLVWITTDKARKQKPNSWFENSPNVITLITTPLLQIASLLDRFEVQQILGHSLQSIMVEGGPKTHTSLMKNGLADILHVFIAPILTGGFQNRVNIQHNLDQAAKFDLMSQFRLGPDVVMEMIPTRLRSLFLDVPQKDDLEKTVK